MQHSLDNIASGIQRISTQLSRMDDDHPRMPFFLSALAAAHDMRYNLIGEKDDINKAIEWGFTSLLLTPDDSPSLPDLLVNLGRCHAKRFEQFAGSLEDIAQSIEYTLAAVSLTSEVNPKLPALLADLGECYKKRFRRTGDPKDLNKSIEHESRGLALAPEGYPYLLLQLVKLGESYTDRYDHTGEMDDLKKAIQYGSRALSMTPPGHPDLSRQLDHLGLSHRKQFERLGEPNDLEKAIEYGSRALRLTPDGDRTLSRRLANLGVSYSVRYRRFGELIDLEKAIEHESRALALNPSSPGRLTNLGAFYYYRFQRLGNVDDLEKSIEYGSRALELTLNDHPELPSRLANLGLSYNHRHQRLGNLNDLEKAIEYGTRAVALTPDSLPHLTTHLTSLGISHSSRYNYLGEMKDLEKSIEYESRALALTPDDHPELANQLSNLAQSYSARFKRLKKLEDHKKAFEYGSRALALTLQDDPSLASRLSNIGLLYRDQFQLLGQQEDIDKSIAYQVRALALTPEGQQDLPSRLASLGLSHVLRFLSLRERDDIEKSIQYASRAVALNPDGDPKLSIQSFGLAGSYVLRYHSTGDASHLEEALKYYRLAIHSPGGTPREKFTYAFMWAKLSSEYNSFDPIEAYQTTMDLLPQFIWLGATNNQRYSDLSSAAALAVHAASAAIASSKHALALEWLEHARCVVWNQSLMLRSPLEELHSAHPDLASRLRKVSYQLHSAASESQEFRALSTGTMTQEQIAQEHRRLASEYNDLVAQARMLPGFGDLLRPVKSKNLIRAARNGPVAVINCDDDRCDALMILPEHETIHHIALPNFNANKARHARSELVESLRDKGIRERGFRRLEEPGKRANFGNVLAILWNDVVKPILDWLGYTCNHAGEMPHITWCPTGALSFLPLHAAGDYNQPQSKTFDYVISSYAPTLTSLLSLTSSSLGPGSRVLGVGLQFTPGHNPLLGTAGELSSVRTHIESMANYTQLVDSQATTMAVLDAMDKHDWIHIACHAHQNIVDPTKSGFYMHDGTLDLASINRRLFKNKGLAFLSACQTATGDERLPDEAIHLASGMLMAGYSSVIATMWSVFDDDAPLVADRVYAQLMKTGKVGNGEAGRSLHNAVAELRNKVGEKKFERWVPYIHVGS
ncbi:unnamed protein product [Rhizoctonia solani]|uniref:CHAT domain-containing protein n=1 Tax=Rhizoctonia solani TaxID=456999 RepID=A0A8H3A9Q2_9AGAM|nr:unnamed protein product [Rhizoctonia solani]